MSNTLPGHRLILLMRTMGSRPGSQSKNVTDYSHKIIVARDIFFLNVRMCECEHETPGASRRPSVSRGLTHTQKCKHFWGFFSICMGQGALQSH